MHYSKKSNNDIKLRKLDDENNLEPESKIENVAGKNIYIFNLEKGIKKVELSIEPNNKNNINNAYCMIKYLFNEEFKFEKNNYEFKKEIKVKKNNNNVELSFEKIPTNNNIKSVIYTAYLYDKIINTDYFYPELLKDKYTFINSTNIDSDEKIINLEFNLQDKKEYSIVVLAKITYEDKSEEYLVYKTEFIKAEDKKTETDKRENDLIFYIIMGSFAFVIIFVFIIVFRIINKRKANNPDIDDEEYNNLQVLKETINEDET